MHKQIDQAEKEPVPTRQPPDSNVASQNHEAMVITVEEG
jgi:hypothetical protein